MTQGPTLLSENNIIVHVSYGKERLIEWKV